MTTFIETVCPDNPADLVANLQLFISEQTATFDGAKLACNEIGGDLMPLSSRERYDLLIAHRETAGAAGASLWVGVEEIDPDLSGTARFGYSDGSTDFSFLHVDVGTLPWAPNEPNNAGDGENCGEMVASGLLNDIPCNDRSLRFVCSKPCFDEFSIATVCPSGQDDPGLNLQLLMSYEKVPFDEAALSCEEIGAKLFPLSSQDQFDLLDGFLTTTNTIDFVWVGITETDDTKTGTERFGYLDGTDTSFINVGSSNFPWSTNQPDDFESIENCVEVWDNHLMNDRDCAARRRYICSQECYTLRPTTNPTDSPTTLSPTTLSPTTHPTRFPSQSPTRSPTNAPSLSPTSAPTPKLVTFLEVGIVSGATGGCIFFLFFLVCCRVSRINSRLQKRINEIEEKTNAYYVNHKEVDFPTRVMIHSHRKEVLKKGDVEGSHETMEFEHVNEDLVKQAEEVKEVVPVTESV